MYFAFIFKQLWCGGGIPEDHDVTTCAEYELWNWIFQEIYHMDSQLPAMDIAMEYLTSCVCVAEHFHSGLCCHGGLHPSACCRESSLGLT